MSRHQLGRNNEPHHGGAESGEGVHYQGNPVYLDSGEPGGPGIPAYGIDVTSQGCFFGYVNGQSQHYYQDPDRHGKAEDLPRP